MRLCLCQRSVNELAERQPVEWQHTLSRVKQTCLSLLPPVWSLDLVMITKRWIHLFPPHGRHVQQNNKTQTIRCNPRLNKPVKARSEEETSRYRCFLNEPSGCECFQSDTPSNTHSTAKREPRTWMWALWGCQGRSSAALWYRRAKWKPAVEMESAEKSVLLAVPDSVPSLPVITAENMAAQRANP